jgi:hypothetical protein
MYLVFEIEMLHGRKYLTKRIDNLSHGRYLPVEVPAKDSYIMVTHLYPIRKHPHENLFPKKSEYGTVEPDVCCVHKLQEARN